MADENAKQRNLLWTKINTLNAQYYASEHDFKEYEQAYNAEARAIYTLGRALGLKEEGMELWDVIWAIYENNKADFDFATLETLLWNARGCQLDAERCVAYCPFIPFF
jgi:hypothetical protein